MNKVARTIRIGIPILSAAVFCLWLLNQPKLLSLGTLFALSSAVLFTVALTAALSRFAACFTDNHRLSPVMAENEPDRLTAWDALLRFGVAVTLFQFIFVFLIARPGTDFLHSFSRLYYRSDVAHYIGIARDWYVPSGDERLRLVFLPLYPLTIRALSWGEYYFAGAFFSALIFSLALLPAAYELFRLDMDRPSAMACARLLFLLPGAVFLRVPMSESLFLFLTLLAVYYARRRRFLWAALFTALSAFTRSLGILLLGFLFIEMMLEFLDVYREDKSTALRLMPRYIGCLLLGCCGTLAYLIINWRVSGNALTFLTYQRENWNQQLSFFFNTASYQAEYALMYLNNGDLKSVLSLSLPNLLCSFAALGLLCIDRNEMRLSYLLWGLVYFALSIGATWLLSGPRYLAMLFPLVVSLQRLCKNRTGGVLMEILLFVVQTVYLLMLAWDMYVY